MNRMHSIHQRLAIACCEAASVPAEQLVIVWRVVTSCVLGCQFCGYSRGIRKPRRTADLETIHQFGQVLAEHQVETGRSILVSWLGGEPLDFVQLPGISQRFHDSFGLRLGVTTNGVPLAIPRIRTSLLAHYEQVTVSVDGLADFHDRVRGRPGLFETLRSAVADLRREDRTGGLLLRANIVLMRENIAKFADYCAEMAHWGFQEVTFNQLGGNDRPEFYPAHRLLPEQVRQFREELPGVRSRCAKLGLTICGSEQYLERISSTAEGARIAIKDCQPGTHHLFVDETGTICPCSFTCRDYGVPLASIQSVESLRKLPGFFAELRSKRRHPGCDDCHATFVFDKFGTIATNGIACSEHAGTDAGSAGSVPRRLVQLSSPTDTGSAVRNCG